MHKKVFLAAKALILNKEKKLLILRRSKYSIKNTKRKLVWDLPGGRIEPGETISQTLEREVLEETGLKIKNEKLLASYEIINTKENEVIGLAFTCELASEKKVKLSDEHSEFKWISMQKALKLKNKKIPELVKKLVQNKMV